jgi:hypothetical protein
MALFTNSSKPSSVAEDNIYTCRCPETRSSVCINKKRGTHKPTRKSNNAGFTFCVLQ